MKGQLVHRAHRRGRADALPAAAVAAIVGPAWMGHDVSAWALARYFQPVDDECP